MTKPTKVEINCETGVESIIELTDAEIAELEAARAQAEADRASAEAEAQAKADAKLSALAKLGALGLTDEETQALIG